MDQQKKSFKMSLLEGIRSSAMMFSVLQTCCCSSGCSRCSKAFLKGLEWLAQQSCIQQDHCNPASTSISGINPYSGPYNPDFKSSFGACNVLWFNICPKIVMWNCALLVVEPCSDQSCVELYIYVFIYIPEACGHVDSADCPAWGNGQLNTSMVNSYFWLH